jgi:hypothetical protein
MKNIFKTRKSVLLLGALTWVVLGLLIWLASVLINDTFLAKEREANGVVVALKHEVSTKVSPTANKVDTIDLYEAEILINGMYGRVHLSKDDYQGLNHRDTVHCQYQIAHLFNIAIIKSFKKI